MGAPNLAPFPWFGGKQRWAPRVWEVLGEPATYIEPFAGSLAILLANPSGPARREIVSDADGHICNFWRAIRSAPDATAEAAEWPSSHIDLIARHRYLLEWGREHADRLRADHRWCDPEAAGLWCWGLSNWIGSGWCEDPATWFGEGGSPEPSDSIPVINSTATRQGVQQGRARFPAVKESRPRVDSSGRGGRGVQQGRMLREVRPHVDPKPSGQGVQQANGRVPAAPDEWVRPELLRWFRSLSHRLRAVTFLCRPWHRFMSPTLRGQTRTHHGGVCAVVLDPPYLTRERHAGLYSSDVAGTSDDTARSSWRWAVEHGDDPRLRIVYFAHEGDFEAPPGWRVETKTLGGINRPDRRGRMDAMYISPHCLRGDEADVPAGQIGLLFVEPVERQPSRPSGDGGGALASTTG